MFLSRSLRQSVVMTHDHSPLSTPLEESPDPEIPAPLWTESGPTTQPAADTTDDTLPAFAVSSSGTVFTAGELAGGTAVPAAMSIPPAAPLPGSLGFPESNVRTTPSSITTGTTSGAASPMSVPVVEGKRSGNGWAKPALVGGLVGAVLSSAVLAPHWWRRGATTTRKQQLRLRPCRPRRLRRPPRHVRSRLSTKRWRAR